MFNGKNKLHIERVQWNKIKESLVAETKTISETLQEYIFFVLSDLVQKKKKQHKFFDICC